MHYYLYKVIEASGSISSGIIKLPYKDIISTITHLEQDGSKAIRVKKLGPALSEIFRVLTTGIKKKLTRSNQAEILNNISLMLRSGVPLTTALKESAADSDIPEIAGDVHDMITSIQGGIGFSETTAKYDHIFPKTILHLIRIGEETGRLDEMLKESAEHLKRMESIISDTKQALLYPAFVFVAMGAGLIFWFYYVVPKIITLFSEMDVELPPLTILLVKISDILQNYAFHLAFGIAVAAVVIVTVYKGNKQFKKMADALLLKLPVCGTIISASVLAFIAEYLSLLIGAGVDIIRSIAILEESIGNEIYREKLGEIKESIKRGEEIAASFRNASVFPTFVTRMIGIGEMSGTLTEQLNHIAEEYKNKLSILVSTIGKMIEPIVLIVAGVMFAIIIGGLLLPIYDLIGQISG